MSKKVKELDSERKERIQTLGGFGRKRTQVVQSKKAYNRKRADRGGLPSDFLIL